jgi:hypothetical protein
LTVRVFSVAVLFAKSTFLCYYFHMNNFFNNLREEISSIWTLLNDTENFLNRIEKFNEYENDFREWRQTIKLYHNNDEIRTRVKQEIIDLRKSLRLQGYDLRLGSRDIKIFGFKSDNATLEGYRRMTIVFNNDNIYYITGEANHQELIRQLCTRYNINDIYNLGEVHCLWYRWKDNILQFCGADSESKDDFEKFIDYTKNNKNLLLKKLKNTF